MIALAEREPDFDLENLTRKRQEIKSHPDIWSIYGDPIKYYEETFAAVLDGANISDHLIDRKHPIVIDLMAPSDTIADLFESLPQKEKQGIAVTLRDWRSDPTRERDESLNITQILGDITETPTWNKIRRTLDGKNADLIMERAAGGLELLPLSESLLYRLVNRAWNLLNPDGGVMLVQAPWIHYQAERGIRTEKWVEKLKEENIDAKYETFRYEVLKIKRSSDSPKNLPLL